MTLMPMPSDIRAGMRAIVCQMPNPCAHWEAM
jgi:hypothetical protein